MSYLLITITYISVCFMLFGIYPGEKQTIQYVLGTISILANSIISNVFVRPENRQHHSAN